jgi:glycosyltransferase involved in cell wall biosynthesis
MSGSTLTSNTTVTQVIGSLNNPFTIATGVTLSISSNADTNNAGEAIYTALSPLNATTLGGATITNDGIILDSSLQAVADEYAVQSKSAADATIFNNGTISAPNLFAIGLNNGKVVNALNSTITGFGGIKIGGGSLASTIINDGKITGTGAEGIYFAGTDSLIGIITNSSAGVITGGTSGGSLAESGILLLNGTVTNAGEITHGGTAGFSVDFSGTNGGNELILDPGQTLAGVATASGTGNLLLLSGTAAATLSHPGNYLGFNTLSVAAGADWTIGNTTSAVSIAGIATITDSGTLAVDGTITGTTINAGAAGDDSIVEFTGVNAGNSLSGAGGGNGINAANAVTNLANGDTIIITPGAVNTTGSVLVGENDQTTLGNAFEIDNQGGGADSALYVPYEGAAPLTFQNLTFSTAAGTISVAIGEAFYTFTTTGASTLSSNYVGNAAPPQTLSSEQQIIIKSGQDSVVSTAPLTNDSTILVTGSTSSLLDTTTIAGTGIISISNEGKVTLSQTAGTDAGQTVNFGTGGTSLALNTLDLSGTSAGFGGTIAGFGANDVIILGGSVLPTVGLGSEVSLAYAGSLLTVAELNPNGTVTATTTLDVGTSYSLGSFVALLGTDGVHIETPSTVDEAKLTFSAPGTTASFETPTDYAATLAPGGTVVAGETVIIAAGTASVSGSSPVTDNGTIIVSGSGTGFLDTAPFIGNGTIIIADAGQVTFANTATASSGNVSFGGNGTLTVDGTHYPTGTIGNFVAGDVINFGNLSFTTGASVTTNGSIATIHDGGTTFNLTITPAGENFHLTQNGDGTELTATPCFLAGTLILTDQGEVPVEKLAIGDKVITRAGDAAPIKWLGRRRYRQPFPPGADIIPVLICKNALGPGLPKRDLIVSPLHAMFLDDVLVPAGRLVNGRSIRALPEVTEISYIHIELAQHDVIFAEGAATETFVDCDSRAMFQNAESFAALYPADTSPAWNFCAPRIESGATLRRIWHRLACRAGGGTAPLAAPDSARLIGFIDSVTHDRIQGWAHLPDHPAEPVELEVLDGDGVIARVVADRYRADLAAAGVGTGRHGFELYFSAGLARDKRHDLHIRRVQGAAPLGQSPVALPPVSRRRPRTATVNAAKTALVLDARWPDPARDAGSNALLSHIEALRALGYTVDLMATDEADRKAPAWLARRGITCPAYPAVEALLRARGAAYDVVYMHRLAVAGPYGPLVASICPNAKRIFSLADLQHLRLRRQAAAESDFALGAKARALRGREIAAMRMADTVITHSAAEAAYLRDACPDIDLHVVPWHVKPRPPASPPEARFGIAFIGGYDHPPNRDAVGWLMDEILPLVWQAAPHITCSVAGAGWPAQALQSLDPRVTMHGFVPDLDNVFRASRLTVAPLRFGAGVKGKVLESFAAGLPCVMTPIAAEGIFLPQGAEALIGDTAAALAALLVQLHDNIALCASLSDALRPLIARHYSQAAVATALASAIAPAKEVRRLG